MLSSPQLNLKTCAKEFGHDNNNNKKNDFNCGCIVSNANPIILFLFYLRC